MDVNDFMQNLNKLKKRYVWKGCFIDDKECSEVVKAHSIQNNRVLNELSENGHVLTSEVNEESILENLKMKFKPTGRRKATTFPGFCGYHDQLIFRSIELIEYSPENSKQNFLYALRALAREYQVKKSAHYMIGEILGLINNNKFEEINPRYKKNENFMDEVIVNDLRHYYFSYLNGSEDALERLELFRERMKKNLINDEYGELITDTIVLEKRGYLAVSSITMLEEDLNGRVINNIGDLSYPLAPLFINVFPQGNKTFVLLSHFKRNSNRYKFIRNDLMKRNIDEIEVIISNIILSNCENFALSPSWWQRKTKKEQKQFIDFYNGNLGFGENDARIIKDETLNLFN